MTQHTVAALFAFALAAAACSRSPGAEGTSPAPIAKGTFHNAAGQRIGVATFTDSGGQPQLEVSVSQLPPGIHGFHLHAVGANGLADTTFAVPEALLGSGAGSLFQSEGTALVLHAGPDDYRTDPSGNSGDRIACAVIERG